MKELRIEYKLIDHTTKQMTKHVYCVKLPWENEISQQDIDRVKSEVQHKFSQYFAGYTLVCEHVMKKEKKALVDGTMKQVKFFKKCCFDYSKGDKPCDDASIFKYKWIEGTNTKGKFDGNSVSQVTENQVTENQVQPSSFESELKTKANDLMNQLNNQFPMDQPLPQQPEQAGGNSTYRKYKLKYL